MKESEQRKLKNVWKKKNCKAAEIEDIPYGMCKNGVAIVMDMSEFLIGYKKIKETQENGVNVE